WPEAARIGYGDGRDPSRRTARWKSQARPPRQARYASRWRDDLAGGAGICSAGGPAVAVDSGRLSGIPIASERDHGQYADTAIDLYRPQARLRTALAFERN